MLTKENQRGMTFWGLLVAGAIFAFFVILFFKLLPPYMQYAKVKAAVDGVSRQQGAGEMEKGQIKSALERRFNIEEVNDVDLNKSLFVEKKPGNMTIRIAYEKRVPFAYNVSIVVEFDHSVQVSIR